MINRAYLKCISCGAITLTRTQIGHKDLQKHSFPCKTCGIELSFELELDQKRAGLKYRDPRNGEWINIEPWPTENHMVYLSDEILVPPDVPDFMSPFIAGFARFDDVESYRHDEGLRQYIAKEFYAFLERCLVHFRKGNWALFDKEAGFEGQTGLTDSERIARLYETFTEQFRVFTSNSKVSIIEVRERIDKCVRRERPLVEKIINDLLASGKMANLSTEVEAIRKLWIENYSAVQPLFQLHYWKPEFQSLKDVKLTDKRFLPLQQLYVNCFETLCRLVMIALSVEAALTRGTLDVPAKKRDIPVSEIWEMSNGNKITEFKKFPLLDSFFVPVLDAAFRNGIGHHAAHFYPETDEIVVSDSKGSGAVVATMSYTEFCDKLLKLYSAFELGALYFESFHVLAEGRYR